MVIFGAVDFTAALVRVAKVLGYRVTVCDARPVFATRARFPLADEVVVDWPGHIGVMGSRRTNSDRAVRLRDAGVDDAGLARVHAPIGLNIGARTPEETAVSICAEIIAVHTGQRDVRPLGRTEVRSMNGTRAASDAARYLTARTSIVRMSGSAASRSGATWPSACGI